MGCVVIQVQNTHLGIYSNLGRANKLLQLHLAEPQGQEFHSQTHGSNQFKVFWLPPTLPTAPYLNLCK